MVCEVEIVQAELVSLVAVEELAGVDGVVLEVVGLHVENELVDEAVAVEAEAVVLVLLAGVDTDVEDEPGLEEVWARVVWVVWLE